MALLKRSELKRNLECFAPEFRKKIESVDSLGTNTNPYAPPVRRSWLLRLGQIAGIRFPLISNMII